MSIDLTLRNALADLYIEKVDAQRVAKDAGLDLKLIDFSGKAINFWTSILAEAGRQNKVQVIIDIAHEEFPANAAFGEITMNLPVDFKDACLNWEEFLKTSTPIANLTLELQAFVSALQSPRKQPRSILLIEAGSGKGKTELLNRYQECCENALIFTHVDLKGGALDPLRILQRIIADLEFFDLTFPRCIEILEDEVAGHSLEQQKRRWAEGIIAFQHDLRHLADSGKLNRLVVLLDTFEQASDETREWIANELLRFAKPRSMFGLVIVVAGQRIPDPPGECVSHCQVLQLRPPQLDDWLAYNHKVHSALTSEQVEILYNKHSDKPVEITKTIQKFILEVA